MVQKRMPRIFSGYINGNDTILSRSEEAVTRNRDPYPDSWHSRYAASSTISKAASGWFRTVITQMPCWMRGLQRCVRMLDAMFRQMVHIQPSHSRLLSAVWKVPLPIRAKGNPKGRNPLLVARNRALLLPSLLA